MAVKRPGFKTSLKANLDATKKDKLIVKVKAGTGLLVRVLPASKQTASGEGTYWHVTHKHYKLKDAEDNSLFPADIDEHGDGTEPDYINRVVRVLYDFGDKAEKQIASDIRSSAQYHIQVLVAEKNEDGSLSYSGPKILALGVTGMRGIMSVIEGTELANEGEIGDPDTGFNILVKNLGEGPEWYKAVRAGKPEKLDDIFPGWEDKWLTAETIDAAVVPKMITADEQREAMIRTFGNELDFEALKADHGL